MAGVIIQTTSGGWGNNQFTASSTAGASLPVNATVGNLVVVVISIIDAVHTVSSITFGGNNMTAVPSNPARGTLCTQFIYYIAASADQSCSIVFNVATSGDVGIFEISGLQASPFDVDAASSGNSTALSSGSVTTNNANDYLFGAGMVEAASANMTAGASYTIRDSYSHSVFTQSGAAEDRNVSSTASYSATMTSDTSGQWVMQMVAFKQSSTTTPVWDLAPGREALPRDRIEIVGY